MFTALSAGFQSASPVDHVQVRLGTVVVVIRNSSSRNTGINTSSGTNSSDDVPILLCDDVHVVCVSVAVWLCLSVCLFVCPWGCMAV